MKAYSLRSSVKRIKLYPTQEVTHAWPVNLTKQDQAFFSDAQQYNVLASWLIYLHDVSLYYDGTAFHGLSLYTETQTIPHQPSHNWRGLLYMHLRMHRQRLPDDQQYVVIHDEFSEGYYHWMIDALPRLLQIRDQLADSTLLLPITYKQKFHTQTLAAFGVKKIEYLHPHMRYVVPRLLTPSKMGVIAKQNPATIMGLRNFLLSKFSLLPHPNLGDRVYISRASAQRRKVTNEEEVTAYMREQGFSVVQLEYYPFAEQVSIMSRVRYLVSIHGAGLTNMLFMQAESRVLELRLKDDGTQQYFYTLASDLGFEYYYQFGTPNDSNLNTQDADLLIDINQLRVNISQMLVV